MVVRENLSKISTLALRRRLEGLVKLMPAHSEFVRGSLIERYLTCGNPNCKCASGERHGPNWYLSVTLNAKHRTAITIAASKAGQVRRWIENYQNLKDLLEKISDINRELLRRDKKAPRAKNTKYKAGA